MMSIDNFLFYDLGVADMPINFEESYTLGILVSTISDLCKERGITIKSLEKDLKFGNGTIRRWDTSKPAISAVVKVACYFDVSVDYLLGMSPYRKHETQNLTVKDIGLSEQTTKPLLNYQNPIIRLMLKKCQPSICCSKMTLLRNWVANSSSLLQTIFLLQKFPNGKSSLLPMKSKLSATIPAY